MSSVEINSVKKSYGSTDIIHGVSINIKDGEFVILVGPSGCGKSTLLRMIAGLETISSGEIVIDGKVVNDLEPKDRDIAMVFQNYALYPQMTVAQNMGFSLELAGVNKRDIEQAVAKAASTLGLEPLLGRYPRQLSGGQRQRVAMGRSIVRNPKVFLFDEPLSNLDAKLRVQMRAEIKALQKRLKTTTVYVTHDQIEAMTMADKIVVLNGGIVEQIGSPLELYDQPRNLFVAGFIGSPSMNFIQGYLEGGEEPFLSVGDGCKIPLENPPHDAIGREVVFGVRPEHIVFGSVAGVPAKVLVVEPTGSETHALVEVGATKVTCVFRDRVRIEADDIVNLSLCSGPAHYFDSSTTLRI